MPTPCGTPGERTGAFWRSTWAGRLPAKAADEASKPVRTVEIPVFYHMSAPREGSVRGGDYEVAVQEHVRAVAVAPWELFAPDGRRLAAVRLDSRFTPRAFAGGRVSGTFRLDTGEDAVAVGDLPAVLRNVPPRAGVAEQGRGG